MSQPSVLIVGAGGMGVVMGYHFGLGGTAVTFLVRPGRLEAMRSPQILYCYDDAQLKEYSSYQAVSSVEALGDQRFDYILVTLDGASCRTDEGTALLRDLGKAFRDTAAVMIMGGVGIGLRAHFLETTGIPEARLLEGTLGSLSYQVGRTTLPLHPPTDPAVLAKASMAYRHFQKNTGFMIAARPAETARAFAALYDRCGISRCTVMQARPYEILGCAFFPLTAVCDLAGWPDAAGMIANKPLLSLCRDSMKDICRLPQFGWTGKLVGLVISNFILAKVLSKTERDTLPLDFHAFNRFHHGGKVRDQDIQVMSNCVDAGVAAGQSMTALKDLVTRYERHCAA